MNDKAEQFTKLQKLNEWRSSKYRQILISKNFLSFNNRQIVSLKDLHEDEYLPRIGHELRIELEEMMAEKDNNSDRTYNHKEIPLETMEPVVDGM